MIYELYLLGKLTQLVTEQLTWNRERRFSGLRRFGSWRSIEQFRQSTKAGRHRPQEACPACRYILHKVTCYLRGHRIFLNHHPYLFGYRGGKEFTAAKFLDNAPVCRRDSCSKFSAPSVNVSNAVAKPD